MDDLIKRLGIIARAEMSNYAERTVSEAAAALTEAQATIARLEAALRYIAETSDADGQEPGQWAINRARTALSPGKGE